MKGLFMGRVGSTESINRDAEAPETRRSSEPLPRLDQEMCVSFSGLTITEDHGWLA